MKVFTFMIKGQIVLFFLLFFLLQHYSVLKAQEVSQCLGYEVVNLSGSTLVCSGVDYYYNVPLLEIPYDCQLQVMWDVTGGVFPDYQNRTHIEFNKVDDGNARIKVRWDNTSEKSITAKLVPLRFSDDPTGGIEVCREAAINGYCATPASEIRLGGSNSAPIINGIIPESNKDIFCSSSNFSFNYSILSPTGYSFDINTYYEVYKVSVHTEENDEEEEDCGGRPCLDLAQSTTTTNEILLKTVTLRNWERYTLKLDQAYYETITLDKLDSTDYYLKYKFYGRTRYTACTGVTSSNQFLGDIIVSFSPPEIAGINLVKNSGEDNYAASIEMKDYNASNPPFELTIYEILEGPTNNECSPCEGTVCNKITVDGKCYEVAAVGNAVLSQNTGKSYQLKNASNTVDNLLLDNKKHIILFENFDKEMSACELLYYEIPELTLNGNFDVTAENAAFPRGDGEIKIVNASGLSYSVNDGSSWTSINSNNLVLNRIAGNYTILFRKTNGIVSHYFAKSVNISEPELSSIGTVDYIDGSDEYHATCYGNSVTVNGIKIDNAPSNAVIRLYSPSRTSGNVSYSNVGNNGTTVVINNARTGTYQVELRKPNNTWHRFNVPTISINIPGSLSSNVSRSPATLSCNGDNDGRFTTGIISGGVPPFKLELLKDGSVMAGDSYTITNKPNSTSETFENLSAGRYSLRITDHLNCVYTSGNRTISQPDAIVVSGLTVSDATKDNNTYNINCFNDAINVSLVVEGGNVIQSVSLVNAGDATKRYVVTNNNRTPTFQNVAAGATYRVELVDSKGCSIATNIPQFTILKPQAELSIDAIIKEVKDEYNNYNISCYGAEDGVVEFEVSGGWNNSGYNISLLNNRDDSNPTVIALDNHKYQFSNLKASHNGELITYTIQVKDYLERCTVTENFTLSEPAQLTLSSLQIVNPPVAEGKEYEIQCKGESVDVSVVVSGGNYPLEIQLQSGGNVYVTELSSAGIATFYNVEAQVGNEPYRLSVINQPENLSCSVSIAASADGLPIREATEPFEINSLELITKKEGFDYHISCYGNNDAEVLVSLAGGIFIENNEYRYAFSFYDESGERYEDYSKSINTSTANSIDVKFSGFIAGNYTFEAIDDLGCILLSEEFEIRKPDPIEFESGTTLYTGYEVDCYDEETYIWVKNPQGGYGEYTAYLYKINEGETADQDNEAEELIPFGSKDSVAFTVKSGFYRVRVSDQLNITPTEIINCMSSDSFNITQPDLISLDLIDQYPPTCVGATDGRIIVSTNVGDNLQLRSYYLKLIDNETEEELDAVQVTESEYTHTFYVGTGDYQVILEDEHCEAVIESIPINDRDILRFPESNAIIETLPPCIGGSRGTITVNIEGGNDFFPGFEGEEEKKDFVYQLFELKDGEPESMGEDYHITSEERMAYFDSLEAGDYRVIIQDEWGCAIQTDIRLDENSANIPRFTYVAWELATCYGQDDATISFSFDRGRADNGIGTNKEYQVFLDGEWYATYTTVPNQQIVINDMNLRGGSYYTLSIKDGDWVEEEDAICTIDTTFYIPHTPRVMFDNLSVNASCSGADDAILEINPYLWLDPYIEEDDIDLYYPNLNQSKEFDFEYVWKDMFGETIGTSFRVNNISAGTYFLTVYHKAFSECILINEEINITSFNFTVQPMANSTYTLCEGEADGILQLLVSGLKEGENSILYAINNEGYQSATVEDSPYGKIVEIDGFVPGLHQISVTNQQGACEQIVDFEVIKSVVSLSVDLNGVTAPSCSNSADGSIKVEADKSDLMYYYTTDDWNTIHNSVNPVLAGLRQGQYLITAQQVFSGEQSAFACNADTIAFILSAPEAFEVSTQTKAASCGLANGEVIITATGGTGEYNYQLLDSNEQQLPNLLALGAGYYTLRIWDGQQCEQYIPITIAEESGLSFDYTVLQAADCNANGIVELSIEGAGAGLNIKIEALGIHTDELVLEGLPAGQHQLEISDDSGCKLTQWIEMPAIAEIGFEVIAQSPALCGEANGEIEFEVSGGTAPYTFALQEGNGIVEGNKITGISGTHTAQSIVVTDDMGCSKSFLYAVSNIETTPISLEVISQPLCNRPGSVKLVNDDPLAPVDVYRNGELIVSDFSGEIIVEDQAAGEWLWTAENESACISSTIVLLEENTEEAVQLQQEEVIRANCVAENGAIYWSVTAGVAPFSYQLNGEDIMAIDHIDGLQEGSYSLSITDAVGCTDVLDFQIEKEANPLLNLLKRENPNCDAPSGSIEVGVVGNGSPFTFHWSHDETLNAAIAESLLSGVYEVYAVNTYGCITNTLNFEVVADYNENISIELDEMIPASCSQAADGQLSISVSGGMAPYTIQWKDGRNQRGERAEKLSAGLYEVLVSDANGCQSNAFFNVSALPGIRIESVEINHPTFYGASNGSISLELSGSDGNYQYEWSNAETTSGISGLAAGIYSVSIFTDAACTVTRSFELTQPDELRIANVETRAPSCFDGDDALAMVEVSGGQSPYTYLWSTGGTTDHLTAISAGEYTVQITDAHAVQIEETIIVPNKQEIILTSVDYHMPNCSGDANGGISVTVANARNPFIEWSTGNTGNSIANVSAGTYGLTITGQDGCVAYFELELEEPELINIALDSIAHVNCFGGNDGSLAVAISGGTAPYSYRWSSGSNEPFAQNLKAGVHELRVTDANGCIAISQFEIYENEEINVEADITAVSCFGGSDASVAFTIQGGQGVHTVSWEDGHLGDRTGLKAGNYTVSISDELGCAIPLSFSISQPANLFVAGINTIVPSCNGSSDGSIKLNVRGGTAPYQVNWSNGLEGDSITHLAAGTYQVSIADANGCTISQSIQLTQPNGLALAGATIQNPICYGEASGEIRVNVSGGSQPYQYLWSNGATTATVTDLLAGDYSLLITDASGCSIERSFSLQDPQQYLFRTVPAEVEICTGSQAYVQVDSYWERVSWTADNGYTANTKEVWLSEEGTYQVEGWTADGCYDKTTLVLTKNEDLLSADFLLVSEAVVAEELAFIEISWPVPDRMEWFFPEGVRVVEEFDNIVIAEFAQIGDYQVGMRAFIDDCSDYVEKTVTIKAFSEEEEDDETVAKELKTYIKEVNVFPNPNTGSFRVLIELFEDVPIDIMLLDMHRNRVLSHHKGNKGMHYNVEFNQYNLVQGMYFLRVQSENEVRTLKVIIK